MANTAIPWAEKAWNVTRGCTLVSAGCYNCYARAYHHRFEEYRGWGPFGEVVTLPEKLDEPRHWKKPARVFVCSRSDLFHAAVPDLFIRAVIATAQECPQHTFLFLTKRPERMLDFNFPPNAWAGVTVENQAAADERLPLLAQVDAPVRFVSVEPLLESVDLSRYLHNISWTILGCESGPNRRPMDPDWVRRIRDDCVAAGVPLFYKQGPNAAGKLVAMPELDGQVWGQYPERV